MRRAVRIQEEGNFVIVPNLRCVRSTRVCESEPHLCPKVITSVRSVGAAPGIAGLKTTMTSWKPLTYLPAICLIRNVYDFDLFEAITFIKPAVKKHNLYFINTHKNLAVTRLLVNTRIFPHFL